jgi:hypothetical protein
MTAQTDLRPETEDRREPGGTRKPRRGLWLIVLLIAMAVAGVVGVVVAANVTDPPAPTRVVTTQDPNAKDRDGRIPTSAAREPNPNEREGRIPTTTAQEPNPNEREGRIPTTTAQEPNPNEREGRVSDNR